MNYLGQFLPSPTKESELLRKLTSSKFKWIWNNSYQNLYDIPKNIIKKNMTRAFYNEKEQLCLEIDV